MRGVARTRRDAIKQGLALLGAAGTGALLVDASPAGAAEGGGGRSGAPKGGNGSGGATTPGAGDPSGGATPNGQGGPKRRTFTGSGVDVSAPDFTRGTLPDAGQRLLISGTLFDTSGKAVGQLFGTYFQLLAFGDAGPTDPVSLQDEVLSFADGTVCGRGLAVADLSAPITFAITGGTGRYGHATGSYTAVQRFFSLGGDGSARFDLLTSGEGSDHGS